MTLGAFRILLRIGRMKHFSRLSGLEYDERRALDAGVFVSFEGILESIRCCDCSSKHYGIFDCEYGTVP